MPQRKADSSDIQIVDIGLQVHMDPGSFDDFIAGHGVPFVHFRAMRCPIGIKNRYDTRRTDDDHAGCSNGFLYTQAGEVICTFAGNNTKLTQLDPGLLTGSSVAITVPRFYNDPPGADPRQVQLLQFDRLYLPDPAIIVPTWELFEAHETGVDRLRFPVVQVTDLQDNLGRTYQQGDFQVVDGRIVWGSNRPGQDADAGHGRVCSVRYLYRPYYYVSQLIHEVRIAVVEDPSDGNLKSVRMPQSAILSREFIYEKEDRDTQAPNPNSPRQVKEPANGGFSAR